MAWACLSELGLGGDCLAAAVYELPVSWPGFLKTAVIVVAIMAQCISFQPVGHNPLGVIYQVFTL